VTLNLVALEGFAVLATSFVVGLAETCSFVAFVAFVEVPLVEQFADY
jgi:hypothetical protein